jgi:hypothetical protein
MNKIEPVGHFHTPGSMEEFESYLANFSGSEAIVAHTCAWMAWNLACKITNEEETLPFGTSGARMVSLVDSHKRRKS